MEPTQSGQPLIRYQFFIDTAPGMENKSDEACEGNEYLCTDGNQGQWNDLEGEGQQIHTTVVTLNEFTGHKRITKPG